MLEERIRILKEQFDAWARGDRETWAKHLDPDIVVSAPPGWPEGEDSVGVDRWWLQAKRLRDDWAEAHAEMDEVQEVGEDWIVARLRYITRGREPGMDFDTPMAAAYHFRGTTVDRAIFHWNLEDALEAVRAEE